MSVLLTVMTKTPNEAFSIEQKLHEKFKEIRLESEWFNAEEVLDFINTDIVKLDEISFGGLKFGKNIEQNFK